MTKNKHSFYSQHHHPTWTYESKNDLCWLLFMSFFIKVIIFSLRADVNHSFCACMCNRVNKTKHNSWTSSNGDAERIDCPFLQDKIIAPNYQTKKDKCVMCLRGTVMQWTCQIGTSSRFQQTYTWIGVTKWMLVMIHVHPSPILHLRQ